MLVSKGKAGRRSSSVPASDTKLKKTKFRRTSFHRRPNATETLVFREEIFPDPRPKMTSPPRRMRKATCGFHRLLGVAVLGTGLQAREFPQVERLCSVSENQHYVITGCGNQALWVNTVPFFPTEAHTGKLISPVWLRKSEKGQLLHSSPLRGCEFCGGAVSGGSVAPGAAGSPWVFSMLAWLRIHKGGASLCLGWSYASARHHWELK